MTKKRRLYSIAGVKADLKECREGAKQMKATKEYLIVNNIPPPEGYRQEPDPKDILSRMKPGDSVMVPKRRARSFRPTCSRLMKKNKKLCFVTRMNTVGLRIWRL